MSIEAMKQALEALEQDNPLGRSATITALRQAIQEATLQEISDIGQEIEQEPFAVAWALNGELFWPFEYEVIAQEGDGAQPLYAASLKQKIEQAHTDHPARHWDRTCPACVVEAEKQEPVAWMQDRNELYIQSYPDQWYKIPLYTAPPKREWVGLTVRDYLEVLNLSGFDAFKAIEAKLKEKNT